MFALTVLLSLRNGTANGGELTAGFDLFHTDPATTSTSVGGLLVHLKGVNFVPGTDIDTIVQRGTPTPNPIPSGGLGTFPIQLNELFLMSVAPQNYTGVGTADLYVTRNDFPGTFSIPVYDALGAAPTGLLRILTHDDSLGVGGGGTFSSSLPVVVDLIFTKVGGNPFNSSDVLAHQTEDLSNDPLMATGVWSHTPRADDPHPFLPAPFSEAGHFYPGVDPTTLGKVLTPEEARLAAHGVLPGQTPEPGTWIMAFAAGLIVPGYVRWHRGRARARSARPTGPPGGIR